MSIFEAKEWWSTTISNNEEFDGNSITVENIDNENPAKNKICVSSFSGFLRVYEPTFGVNRVENLLYEKYYDNPILQINSGNLMINSPDKQLAILQSKRLFVVQFFNLRGATSVKMCYEHKLVRNGFNFCLGRIGEKNYDMVFVQSIDGVISIYEQDSLVNSISISEIIFPGPIAVLSRKDYFLISNTAYEVECYSYNNLATITSKSDGDKRIQHAWVATIGELVKDVKIIDNKMTKKQEVLILSETMLTLLDDNGKFLFQRKLDYEPMAIFGYNIEDVSGYSQNKMINMMYMISTNSDHVLVYKGVNLAWALKVFDTSVFLKTAEFEGMKGLIVSLSDSGRLSVLYLGMEPVKNNKIQMPSKNLDLNQVVAETEKLLNIVDNYEKGVVVIPNETLELNVEVDPSVHFDDDITGEKIYYSDHSGKILRTQVKVSINFPGNIGAENVRISVITPYNVICQEPMFTISKLSAQNSPFTKVLNFRVLSSLFPTYTNVKIYATYTAKNGQSGERTINSTGLEIELPLSLFVRTTSITKDAKNKITLCTDKDPLSVNINRKYILITKIFQDLTENYIDSSYINSSPNMIGFVYPNRSEVTVIVSKNAGRYRIQSSHYEALMFITHQIIIRLNEYYQYEVSCYIEDDLNIEFYFPIVENHFKFFGVKKMKNEELEKYTSLYTVIQKSLLNKYKEKNPPNLNNLDFLLKNVYKSVNKQTDELLKVFGDMKLVQRDLIIWTESLLYMLKLKGRLSDEHFQILRDSFPLDNTSLNSSSNENSWQDVTLANMTNLFKYYFSGERDNLQEVKEIRDLDKWKKYFVTLCDRLVKSKGFSV